MPKKRASFFFNVLILLLAVCGASFFLIFFPSFETSRAGLDHLARDGNLEMYGLIVYQSLRIPGLIIGGFLLVALVVGLGIRPRLLTWIDQGFLFPGKLLRRFVQEMKELCHEIRAVRITRIEGFLLIILVLLTITLRAAFIMRPMAHDEAYTVVVFASAPLKEGLSDYHHPNNHLFHTLLVHFAIELFGSASSMIAPPWVVRLPAFLAGILLVPTIYFFSRRLYGRQAALLAACFTAGMPALIDFSTNARGYTMIMLFTLWIIVIANYVRKRKSLLGWGLLVLLSTLGFYTIPIFLYSYAVMFAWFFLTIWIRDEDEQYRSHWEILKWLVISGAATFLLTILLYSPVILRYRGVSILFPDMSASGWGDFVEMMISRSRDNIQQWLVDLPTVVGYLGGLGVFLSIVMPPEKRSLFKTLRATAANRFSPLLLLLATVSTMLVLTIVLRPNLYPRFVSFLIPLLILWTAAGWSTLIKWIERWLRLPGAFSWGIVLLVFGDVVAGSGLRVASYAEKGLFQPGSIELTSSFLKPNLRETDLIVVSPPHDAVLWYYSRLHGIDMKHYKRELPFFRAFVLVDPGVGATLESVLIERGPELFFFDLNQAKVVFQSSSAMLYECIPDADLIRTEYGVK